jgi:hypothetical protein
LSSILKALKKLETESAGNSDLRSRPSLSQTQKTARHRVRESLFFHKGILAVSLVVILAGGAWFIFSRKAPEKPLEPVAKSKTEHKKAAAVPERKAPLPEIAQKEKAGGQNVEQPEPAAKLIARAAPAIGESAEKATGQAAKQPEPEMEETTVSVPAKRAPVEKPLPSTEEEEIKADTYAATSDENVFEPGPGENSASSRSYIDDYKRAEPSGRFELIAVKNEDESGLKLQAIAWSENPEHRMAVINNNIVREGGSVEGAAVTHIGEDMVVFKKGGEEWKQLFRLR